MTPPLFTMTLLMRTQPFVADDLLLQFRKRASLTNPVRKIAKKLLTQDTTIQVDQQMLLHLPAQRGRGSASPLRMMLAKPDIRDHAP